MYIHTVVKIMLPPQSSFQSDSRASGYVSARDLSWGWLGKEQGANILYTSKRHSTSSYTCTSTDKHTTPNT